MNYWIIVALVFGLFLTGCSRLQSQPTQPKLSPSESAQPTDVAAPTTVIEQIKPSAEELAQ